MAPVVKSLPASSGDARDVGSIPRLGRFPGVGNGNPLHYSCLENPMDRRPWWATVHGVAKSQTWLSNCASMHAHTGRTKGHGLETGMRQLSEGNTNVLYPALDGGYTYIHSCQNPSNCILLLSVKRCFTSKTLKRKKGITKKKQKENWYVNAVLCLVAQLCPTLCDPMDCPPGSTVHGDSLGKNTGGMPSSRGFSQPRDQNQVSCNRPT